MVLLPYHNEAEYYLNLLSEAHPQPIKAAFAPSSIATASAFKARLLSSALMDTR
ncbi:MAG: hypothetical protein PHE17_17795 [Thiothrix sp.]|uniref:hypothetical protein n=1 Tax=Thiothrix sp. TaxID=1032 RepID=UPI002638A0A3|nr:hypothetical protein [Thiothrix sp.]MDD5394875.1 hypothetical protein [Thiothrix sp.]